MTRLVGIALLASAFAPLMGLLALLKYHEFRWLSWVILAGCAAAVLLLALALRSLVDPIAKR